MKSKKGAFANSSTGYGKRHSNNSSKSTNKSPKTTDSSSTAASSKRKNKHVGLDNVEKPKIDDDNDLNSGFGSYLRSNEGVEMMKIFVFANTMMVFVTMAWPHVKEQYIWFMEWLDSFKQY